jgi:hypothetical protein
MRQSVITKKLAHAAALLFATAMLVFVIIVLLNCLPTMTQSSSITAVAFSLPLLSAIFPQ